MMNYKKICLPTITLILVMALAGMVSAATFTTPTTGTIITGTGVNFTIASTDFVEGSLANCTITVSSSNTGESPTSFNEYAGLNISNHTDSGDATAPYANATLDSTLLGDATDYSLGGTCYNATDSASITSITVTIDNQVPSIQSCTLNAVAATNTTSDDSSNTIACTFYNATTVQAYYRDSTAHNADGGSWNRGSCTTAFTSTAAHGAGSTATCNIKQASDNANVWYFDATDGTNTTTGTNYQFKLTGNSNTQDNIDKGGIGGGIVIPGFNFGNDKNAKTFFFLATAAITGFVILVGAAMMGKKKGRRR